MLAERKNLNFGMRVHVCRVGIGTHLQKTKKQHILASKHTKKPPAGRNLFYLAPPPLAPLAPAGLRSVFGGGKGIFLIFFGFLARGCMFTESESTSRRGFDQFLGGKKEIF